MGALVDEVLAVVDDEQRVVGGEPEGNNPRDRSGIWIRKPERLCHGGRQVRRIPKLGQRYEPDTVPEAVRDLSSGCDGEARLPRPARPDERHEPAVVEELWHRPQLGFATDQTHERRRKVHHRFGRWRPAIERRVLPQDGLLEMPQRHRRSQAELIAKSPPVILIRRERVGRPSRTIEGVHELAARTLAKRIRSDPGNELGHKSSTFSRVEALLSPLLLSRGPQFDELSRFGIRPTLVGELRVRCAPPQRQRILVPPLPHHAPKPARIDVVFADLKPIAERLGNQDDAHEFAQLRDP